jgi:hypothetical protein
MAPIDMRRYDTSTREILFTPFTQPSRFKSQQPNGLLSCDRPVVPHPPVISSDTQTFPILPGQLETHLEHARQRLTHHIPTQLFSASGSAPSPSLDETLVLNPFPETIPTVHAFQASTLGMPSMAEYTRVLTRYLDEMIPNRRGKALIDSGLLERVKLTLTSQHNRFPDSDKTSSDSDSARDTPCSTGGSWDTPPFRRWVRSTFVYRQATPAELECAVDFGLLPPPESSLSGPGVSGHAPSTCLSHSVNLVFHHDRPIAVRSRIYKIILRAHWIMNHAGRDRTWAMVQEVCSFIPKRLVYDFVAACPTCRMARSGQYGAHAGSRREVSMDESNHQVGEKGLIVERGLPSIPVVSIPHQAVGHLQQPKLRDQDLQETQQEMPMVESLCTFWAGIKKLVEARRGQDEDMNVLEDSPTLGVKGGLLIAGERVESIGLDA